MFSRTLRGYPCFAIVGPWVFLRKFSSSGLVLVAMLACLNAHRASATTTTLSLTSGVNAVTTVASGTQVTLTAVVQAGPNSITTGQVKFCDAAAIYCTDIHLLGTAQLTSAGTAILTLTPGIGSHSYKAMFVGTISNAASSSSASVLTVTGVNSTATTITSSGSIGDYTLEATVVGSGSATLSPTGAVSFLDSTNGGSSVVTSQLVAGTPGFGFSNPLNPGQSGVGLAVGDFNGDGKADVVTVDSSGNLTVGLGNGDGTFHELAPANLLAYTFIESIVVSDFNGDGKADLAITGSGNNVTVLLGNGDGTFTLPTTVPTGQFPVGIAVADWNGDGIPDLAITNEKSNNVTVLLGNGDGTFTAAATSPTTGAGPGPIVVGDFNGDGIPDFAVLTFGNYTVTVFLGNGDGAFTAVATSAATGFDLGSFAVADFNGDGKADIAVTDTVFNTISIYLGHGDGTFAAASSTPAAGNFPGSVAVGDFNGDGIPDLAVVSANSNSLTGPTVLLGKGDGTFSTVGPFMGIYSEFVAAADFNGDGNSDLVFLNGYTGNTPARVLLAQPEQTSVATVSNISIAGVGTHQIAASYVGDSNFGPSTSASIGLTARTVPPALTLTANPASATYGQQVTLTATLNPYSTQDESTNGEQVTFLNGGVSLGTGTLSSGVTTLSITSLPVGSASLSASYAGDTDFLASNSSTLLYSVTEATPAITWPSPSAITYGTALSAVILNATASTPGSFTYTPASGTVLPAGSQTLALSFSPTDKTDYGSTTSTNLIMVNQAPLTVTASSGSRAYGVANPAFTATLTGSVNGDVITASATSSATTTSPVGTYPILPAASGPGIANYTINSVDGVLTVVQAGTSLALTSSAASAAIGTTITFTATVVPAGNGTPTGSAQFISGTIVLATVPLAGLTASYTTNALGIGTDGILVVYSGDSNFKGSTALISELITPPPDFTVSSNPSTVTIQQGQSATVAITVTPINGYNQAISFSCAGLPSLASCTFMPNTVTPNGGPVTTQLTITTTAPTSAMLHRKPWRPASMLGPDSSIALGILICLLPPVGWRRKGRSFGVFLLLAGVLMPFLSGCATASPPTPNAAGTPTGSSQVTVALTGGTIPSAGPRAVTLTVIITN